MNNKYVLGVSGCLEETETGKDYTEFRRVKINPDVFEELKKYNPMKIVYWGLAGLVTGTALTIKYFNKKEKG